jgi:hypothetical protein
VYVRACCVLDDSYNGFGSASLGVTTLTSSAAHGWAAVEVLSFSLSCVMFAIFLAFVDSVPWLCARSVVVCGCEQVVSM